ASGHRRRHEVPEVMRVIDPRGHGAAIARGALAIHRERPHARAKVLVAPEVRGLKREIGAGEPAARASKRIAGVGNHADGRFAPDVPLDAGRAYRRSGRKPLRVARAGDDAAYIRPAYTSVDLGAEQNRLLAP